jgi:hypothetical protein
MLPFPWRRLNWENTTQSRRWRIIDDNGRHSHNEEVDEPWWQTWRSDQAVMYNDSPKPYSPSLGARSLRTMVPETYAPGHRCMLMIRMKKSWQHSTRGGKNLDVFVSSCDKLWSVWWLRILRMYWRRSKNKLQKEVTCLQRFGPDLGRPFTSM